MSWLCLIKHKWIYKVEDITLLKGVYSNFGTGTSYEVTKTTDVRFCERCYKKQKSRWDNRWSSRTNKDWVSWELNESEKRDKKLKELGI